MNRSLGLRALVMVAVVGCHVRQEGGGATGVRSWAWSNPLPQGQPILGLWAARADEAWASTATSTLHFDGLSWSVVSEEGASSIWGSGPRDVWAVGVEEGDGGRAVRHYDGNRWSLAAVRSPGPIWGTGPSDAWLPGLRWTGRAWSPMPRPMGTVTLPGEDAGTLGVGQVTIGNFGGTSSSDLWASVDGGGICHWDGRRWALAVYLEGYDENLRGGPIWASGVKDVWVGIAGSLHHWNGVEWRKVRSPAEGEIKSLWGAGRPGGVGGERVGDVWATATRGTEEARTSVWHWDGEAWTVVAELGHGASVLAGSGAEGVWASSRGGLAHWDGHTWALPPPAPLTEEADLYGGWASAPDDAWAFGAETPGSSELQRAIVAHWDGFRWSSPQPLSSGVASMWGSSSDDVWAVGGAKAFHWNGSLWSSVAIPPSAEDLVSVWGSAADDVWAGGTAVLHWGGQAWRTVPAGLGRPLSAVWGSAANDVWAIGDAACLHWDGKSWSSVPTPVAMSGTGTLSGTASNDVWATGFADLALHWNGHAWQSRSTGPFELTTLLARAPDDAWATSWETREIVHWDGRGWSVASRLAQGSTGVNALFGAGHDAWAVGARGTVLHSKGPKNEPRTFLLAMVAVLAAIAGAWRTLRPRGRSHD